MMKRSSFLLVLILCGHFFCFAQGKQIAKMLMIAPDEWISSLDYFVQHKQQQDIAVVMLPLSEAGYSAREIYNTILHKYQEDNFTYLLLLGDDEWLPAPMVGGYPSDNDYGMLEGDDLVPDVAVGRLPAESLYDLKMQLHKIVSYEQQSVGQSTMCYGIAGENGYEGEYDFEHIRRVNALLASVGLTVGGELFDGNKGGLDLPGNPTAMDVVDIVNKGANMINYAGHGTDQTWSTTQFGTHHTMLFTNTSQWPLVISLACGNGNYVQRTCLAESWLRASYNGEPTGAVAMVAAAADIPWKSPMVAHQAMIDSLTSQLHGARVGDAWLSGLRLALSDTVCEPLAHSWLLFGDPSMRWEKPSCSAITGFEEETTGISVYPNPSCGRLHMELDGSASLIRMFDMQGSLVKQYIVDKSCSRIELDLQELTTGLYMVQYGGMAAKVLLTR